MSTSLFLLLREYADVTAMPTASYINADNCLEEAELVKLYKRLIDTIDFFRYEKCDRFFDMKNLIQATYPFDLLKDYYEERDEYPCTAENIIVQIGLMGFVDWKEEYEEDDQRYYLYDADVSEDMLGEVARNIRSNKAVVLLNMDAIKHSSPIKLSYANKNCWVEIEHVNSIEGLHKWFSNNRKPKRIFTYSSKHGDFYRVAEMIPGTNKRAAQLECTQTEAQELLDLAVGNDVKSSLWYYDSKYNKHIYFENQNEMRLAFHGYHLSENEENFSNISKDKLSVVMGDRYDKR